VVTLPQSLLGAVVLIVVGTILALSVGGAALQPLTQGLALGIVGLSLVLLTGYAGQISLCQLTFLGVGAFVMGKISGGDSWWGLVLAVVVSGALGALVALPALRLRGLYLALATLAFGEAAYFAFFNNNVVIPQGSFIPVGRLRLPFMHAVGDRADMIEVLVATALCAVLVGVIRRSAFGRRLVALSDSPAAFATVGLSASRTKVYVFALSAAMAGFGGVLYAGQPEAIGSNDVQFFGSLTLLLFVAIWGMRSLTGALLGGMTAAALPVLESHLPGYLSYLTGIVAGTGIALLGKSPDGILGFDWLVAHFRLPFSDHRDEPPELLPNQDVAHAS
jgi:branched-chain amino acid transport system permease protein